MPKSWEQNRKKKEVQKILDKEEIQGLVDPRVPPDKKYKVDKFPEPVIIGVGAKFVGSIYDNYKQFRSGTAGIQSYFVGVVVDFHIDESRFLGGTNINIIYQLVKVSNDKYVEKVGRLYHMSILIKNGISNNSGWYGNFAGHHFVGFNSTLNHSDYGV